MVLQTTSANVFYRVQRQLMRICPELPNKQSEVNRSLLSGLFFRLEINVVLAIDIIKGT